MAEHRGRPEGRGRRVCIVVSRFNLMVTERLLEGARAELARKGVAEEDVDVIHVPGAWEITAAARLAAERGYDAIVALGCVVRGETAHFEYICRSVTHGLTELALRGTPPIGFGVLTTDTVAQALDRSGGEVGDQGASAAAAALEMADLWARVAEGGA